MPNKSVEISFVFGVYGGDRLDTVGVSRSGPVVLIVLNPAIANQLSNGYCQIKIICYSFSADLGLVSIVDVWRKPIKYRDLPNL